MTKLTSTAALVLGLAAAGAHAAELGEATVRSHAGEQLVADVELVDLTTQDLADLQVRLASRNVFQGANVSMSPALTGMNITVVKRDGRRVLHLTTSAPIQSEVLHLYFELTSAGRQSVRGVSLWLPAAPPAPPAPVVQPTRIVAAPPAPVPEQAPTSAPSSRPRPAGVTVQLAAAGTPGRQATKAETELMGAVERAFAARSTGKTPVEVTKPRARPVAAAEVKATEKVDKPAPAASKVLEKPEPVVKKVADKPAIVKITEKHAPVTAKVAEKPVASIVPPLPAIVKPTEPVPDKAMLKKLAELEAKLKSLQAAVAKNAAAPKPPEAKAVAPAKPAPAATPAAYVEQSAAVVTATEPPGRSAAGKITDARAEKPAPGEPAPKAEAAHGADKPADGPLAKLEAESERKPEARPEPEAEAKPEAKKEAKKEAPPPEEPVKEKKMSRPKVLTMLAAGTLALVLVVGVIVHLVRRRKAKQASAQIKVWQSWRKKAIAEAATAEEEAPAEAGAA